MKENEPKTFGDRFFLYDLAIKNCTKNFNKKENCVLFLVPRYAGTHTRT
jgi:hypothetical protein